MKTKFINPPSDKLVRRALRSAAMERMKCRIEAFEGYRKFGTEYEHVQAWGNGDAQEFFAQYLSFNDYGVERSYIAPHTFDDQPEGYFRFLLCTGGPREEIRFYYSQGAREAYRIIYVYSDYSTGVHFDITREEWARWLFQQMQPEESILR